jgi:signal peptidase I
MKNNNILLVSIVPLIILVAIQTVYILLPAVSASQFINVRPLIYFLVIIIYAVFVGKDERPIPKGVRSTLLARFGVIAYFAVLFLLGALFGFGRNTVGYGFSAFTNNFWTFGTIALLYEYLRFRIIKSVSAEQRSIMATVITLAYTFIQLDSLRGFMRNEKFVEFMFVSIIPVLALNAVLSYMSHEGSLAALLMLRATYSITPVLLPYMPNLSKEVWAVISCSLLLITLIFYHYNMNMQIGRLWRTRDAQPKQARVQKKSKSIPIILISVVVVLGLFGFRVFAYFPIVVLTNSMEGTIDRNSVVMVEKVRFNDVFDKIDVGDIILYRHGNTEIMHRIIETRENESGDRVYITQGDANPEADFYAVEARQIIGITRAYIPHIGYPIVVINSLFNRQGR